jgi:hypothetical protein
MAEFIEILSPSALKDLQTANLEVVKLVANIDKVGQNMAKINTPSGSDTATKKLVTDYQNLEKQLAKNQQQLEKNRLQEIKLAQAREKAFDKYDAQLAKEQAKLNASSNLYNKVQQKLNVLSNEYKALAVQKELTGKLTDKEAQRYDFLQGKIQKYDATLKAVDATMGKYQRNVGNYASGFNVLGNSVNQLTREMPAFTYSVQTGFMALSNNIPIFTDAIGNAIRQNKELAAQGQPTTSVLKQLAGAFFSWQTLLGVGITLLTVYGKEIGEFIKGLTKGSESIQTLATQTKQLNESRQKSAELASKEISELDRLYKVSQNVTLSINQRKAAVDKLQELYPNFLANIADENILNGKAEKQYYKLRDAILAKYTAQAIGEKLAENAREGLDRFLELQQKIVDTENEINRLRISGNDLVQKGSAMEKTQTVTISNAELILAQERLLAKLKKDMLLLKDSEREKNGLLIKTMEDLLQKSKDLEITEKKGTKTKKENTKATKENDKVASDSLEALENTISALQKEQKEVSFGSAKYEALGFQLKLLQTIYDGLTKKAEKTTEAVKGIELSDEQIYEDYYAWLKLKDATDEYIKTITSNSFNQAFDNIGLSSAKMFMDFDAEGKSTFDKLIEGADTFAEKFAITFQTIGDVAQDVFNMMQNLSTQRLELQLVNLEKERDIAIAFAGESTMAREELEEQYNERKRKLQREQAQQQKKLAVFNILINTAQGVVSALASTPPNVPLSIAIGVIGALQAGIVSNQQIPQFAKGTDSAPEGWAITQEKGREIITDKSGKVKSLGNDKGAQYTYLNKGDKVFTNADTEAMMFNSNLNNMLLGNGIVMPKVDVSISTQAIENKLDNLTSVISNKEGLTIVRDERGERKYLRKQAETKELLNNVLTYKGIDV